MILEELGPPDLSIGGFELWIHGRQFPDAEDYWDGNWLVVTARCSTDSAIVEARGPILHLRELATWEKECKEIYTSLSGKAHLDCMEPYLNLELEMDNKGTCKLSVSITHNHMYEEHSFLFDIDQSYLPPLIANLELILNTYPLKGTENE